MANNQKQTEFITIDEIRALFKSRLRIAVTRAAIYGYIARKNFPKNIGIGTPRVWKRHEVLEWLDSISK